MAKITSKLQVTIPKALAEELTIQPGDEIEWRSAGASLLIVPARRRRSRSITERLARFDEATARQRERERAGPRASASSESRGWTREGLYERGGPR